MIRPTFLLLGFSLALNLQAKVDFNKHIVPILKRSCYECHGAKKQKAKLRLDSPDHIRSGSENGAVVIAGNPKKSSFYSLTILPKGDDDVMPSKGKLLSRVETELIKRWITEGANMGDGKKTATFDQTGKRYIKPPYDIDLISKSLKSPDSKLVSQLKLKGVFIREISSDGKLLELSFKYADKVDLERLKAIKDNIIWLDLAGLELKDDHFNIIGQLKNIQRLKLQSTNITDKHLEQLKSLKSMTSLNLYNTKVSDSGITHLSGLKNMREIYLWNSKVTASGAKVLKGSIPGLNVNLGN